MTKAFTLVESLVTILIIVVLSLIILPNYYSAKQQLALQRSAFKLAQDIRTVREMAMSAEEFEGEIPGGGYGISLSPGTSYTIFVDLDSDGIYDNPSEKVGEDIFLENGIEINSISPASLISIFFFPPDLEVFFMNPGGSSISTNSITINIAILNDLSKNINLIVNKAGLIYVE